MQEKHVRVGERKRGHVCVCVWARVCVSDWERERNGFAGDLLHEEISHKEMRDSQRVRKNACECVDLSRWVKRWVWAWLCKCVCVCGCVDACVRLQGSEEAWSKKEMISTLGFRLTKKSGLEDPLKPLLTSEQSNVHCLAREVLWRLPP